MSRLFVLAMACCLLSACAYHSPVGVVQGVGVHSSYEDKVPGKFAILIRTDMTSLNRSVTPSSYICSAHSFEVDFDTSFDASIMQASESCFEKVTQLREIPNKGKLATDGFSGYVLINLKHFEPRLNFSSSFFSAKVTATADIGIEFSVRDINGNILMGSMSNASRSVDGDGGPSCGDGGRVLSDAVTKAMREMLEGYVERISNSQKLRDAMSKSH